MDPFSKRLRKQRERSSLHARQLNKNAMTLLHRQLYVLERRQQQNARTHRRTRQAILQELDACENLEHEGLEPRVAPPRQRSLPPLSGVPNKPVGSSSVSSLADNSGEDRRKMVTFTGHALPHVSNHSEASLDRMETLSPFRRCHTYYGPGDHSDSDLTCRFRALSPLSPCRYFPCCKPQSYHRLKVSDIDLDPLLLGEPECFSTARSQTTVAPSEESLSFDAHSTTASSPRGIEGRQSGRSASASTASRAQQAEGHISPRTSIQERLRGLRQLAREMRNKNDEKKPRDWAINYGSPVSRRLLRKPVVPVSEKVL